MALSGCKTDNVDNEEELPSTDQSEAITFTDSAFKQALIDNGFDLNGDGEISSDEAQKVEELHITDCDISDLSELNYFTNLMVLDCSKNSSLAKIDQFENTKLTSITCNDTSVTLLDICLCPDIKTLYANSVTAIFVASDEQGAALVALGDKFSIATGYSIIVSEEEYTFSDDNFRIALLGEDNTIDSDSSGVITRGEVYLAALVDISASEVVSTATSSTKSGATRSETSGSGAGYVKSANLLDFASLKYFNCDNNPDLIYVDLSNCPNIAYAYMNCVEIVVLSEEQYSNNSLVASIKASAKSATVVSATESIDFANAAVKSYLVANYDTSGDGEISYQEAVTVTKLAIESASAEGVEEAFAYLPYLKELSIKNCTGITTLDLSTAGGVESLDVSGTPITRLEINTLANLTYDNIVASPSSVTAIVISTAQSGGGDYIDEWESLLCDDWETLLSEDPNATIGVFVIDGDSEEVIAFNDAAFESFLLELGIDADGDGSITVLEAARYTGAITLTSASGITDVTELKYLTAITSINTSSCSTLTEIDMTHNTSLKSAQVNNGNITSIILPGGAAGSSALTGGLYVQNIAAITDLDVSVYPNIYSLFCGTTSLKSLDLTGCSSLATLNISGLTADVTEIDLSTNSSLSTLTFGASANSITTLDISKTNILQCAKLTISGTSKIETLTLSAAQAAADSDNDYANWAAFLADSSTGEIYISGFGAIWENGKHVVFEETGEMPTAPTMTVGTDTDFDQITWSRVSKVSDEFNDDGLNVTKWCADPSANGWSWLGAADGLFQEERVQVTNGNLTIETGAFSAPVGIESSGSTRDYNYYCGLVRTLATGSPGCYYECRMKMNKTELGGGFWLMAHPSLSRRHEIDVQECVGVITQLYDAEAGYGEGSKTTFKDWANIFHSNAIYTKPDDTDTGIPTGESKVSSAKVLSDKNSDDYNIYGFWWKGDRDLRFYLNGEYQYTLVPSMDFDVASHVQLSIQVYEWNLVPEDGGEVTRASVEDRTSYFDWVRVWEVVEE